MPPQLQPLSSVPLQTELVRNHARGFVIVWAFALIFYFLEYAVRSSPSDEPQLAISFSTQRWASVRSSCFITTPIRLPAWSLGRLSTTWREVAGTGRVCDPLTFCSDPGR